MSEQLHGDVFHPQVSDSHVSTIERYEELYRQSMDDGDAFWGATAREMLSWKHDFHQVSDTDFAQGMIAWFLGGKLNACYNCVDRHVAERGDQVAIIWEADEPGEGREITYRELQREVSRLANVLRHNDIRRGDRVAIYMPMIPEAAFAMLACARIGAV
ncbi:MAG TPA: acetyl-coenzyme A synthetase N-terminal domain-containing protein, partial [Spirochaetia bacterium]|nr:acetyl-coenzyme A synthetase N-terminal domain-containing protein [Spirochaetia bacterium]